MKAKPKWFKCYPDDFELDEVVRLMDDADLGFYWRCIFHAFREGSIPADIETLARVMGRPVDYVRERWRTVGVKWQPHPEDPSRLVNPRLERERLAANDYWRERSDLGRKAARKRWNAGRMPEVDASRIPDASTDECQRHATKTETVDKDVTPAFDLFWSKYPRKTGKDLAAQIWLSLDLDAIADQVLAGLDRWLNSEEWKKENGKFIPSPAKWLSGKRWLDEPKPADDDLPEYWQK
jgi:hypothetical protein